MRFIPLFILIAVCCGPLAAQQKQRSVRVDEGQMSMTYFPDPYQADAKLLPFIQGKREGGAAEPFGILLGGINPSSTVLELRSGSSVVNALTVDHLLGRATPGKVTVRRESPPFNPRRSETVYTMQLPGGQAELFITALAAGDEGGSTPPELIMTFAIRSSAGGPLTLRLLLPFAGSADIRDHGFTLLSPAGNAAIAGSVYPSSRTLVATRKILSITSGPADTGSEDPVPVLWMVLHGVTGNSPAAVRTLTTEKLDKTHFGPNNPHLAVVSAADREASQPTDTVTYFVTCANIGTGDASDVVLKNPIPEGGSYVEGSATTGGATLSFDKSPAGQAGRVQLIRWSFPRPFRPGDERTVRFMVVVR